MTPSLQTGTPSQLPFRSCSGLTTCCPNSNYEALHAAEKLRAEAYVQVGASKTRQEGPKARVKSGVNYLPMAI